tara:strand:+ start:1450 stop:1935 length:486 start_codon:yes stop_codon:yes gene_type:complete
MRIVIPILIVCLAFPINVYADPPTPPTETSTETVVAPSPKITGIKKGDVAPYTGVLLNTLAAAQIFTEKSFLNEECQLRIDYAVQKEIARMNLLLNSTKASMDSMEQKYTTIVKIKDTEIERLSKIALEPKNDYSAWWAAGGVIVGIALTIGVVYAVGELK